MAMSKHALTLRLVLLQLREQLDADDMVFALLLKQIKLNKRQHRFWVHHIVQKRKTFGAYYHLVKHLELDLDKYREYFRMSPQQMETILGFVGPIISKKSVVREAIDAKQRLAMCIRFLATGETYTSLASQYRVGKTTLSRIVPEVCEAIWATMQNHFMPFPNTSEQWRSKAVSFEEKWDYPHCVGAIDGKHVVIEAPANSGSLYFNYKHSFSVVLLGLVDADYKFIYVDIGAYGKQSDGGIFSASTLGRSLSAPSSLQLPNDAAIGGAEELGPMPYVVVADEAFPLQQHIIRPYPGKSSTEEQDVYNYRHSRARRVVENAFGILSERWRVYHTKIAVNPECVIQIVQATTVLHNMLQMHCATQEPLLGNHVDQAEGLQPLHRLGTRGTEEAMQTREKFTTYFNSHPLPWQEEYVRRGSNM